MHKKPPPDCGSFLYSGPLLSFQRYAFKKDLKKLAATIAFGNYDKSVISVTEDEIIYDMPTLSARKLTGFR